MADEYDPACIRLLVGMEPPEQDPDDPRVRWCREFLGLPEDPAGDEAPGSLRREVSERLRVAGRHPVHGR